jgi:hypothetical protein
MQKITFVNENAPYVSAENLNQMQTNVENEIDKLYGSVLYEGSGSTHGVTLNESAENFKYIEIFYGYGNSGFGNNSCKLYYPNVQYANMMLGKYDGTSCQIMMAGVYINGTSVTINHSSLVDLTNATPTFFNDPYIRIYRVIGYK